MGVGVEDEGVKVGGGQLLVVGWMVYYICVLRLERGFLLGANYLDTHIAAGDELATAECGKEGLGDTVTVAIVGVCAGFLVGIGDKA